MLGVTNTSSPFTVSGCTPMRLDALGDAHRVHGVAEVVEQNDELVAAEPGDGICLERSPHVLPAARLTMSFWRTTPGQTLGKRHQQLIAGGMPEAVVHVLEAIEIDEEHRKAIFGWRSRRAIDRASRSMNSTRFGRCVR